MTSSTFSGATSLPDDDSESPLLIAALNYARRGWPVTPLYHTNRDGSCSCTLPDCKPNPSSYGKHPIGGGKLTTTDEAKITFAFQKYPLANLGVQCGKLSGLVMPESDDDEAERTYLWWCGGDSPIVPTMQTKRGRRRLFKWREGLPLKAKINIGKLDFLLGNRGFWQAVFPPSTRYFPDGSFFQYTWLPGLSPDDVDPGVITDEMLARLENMAGEDLPSDNQPLTPMTIDELSDAVTHLNSKRFDDYQSWIEVGMAVFNATGGSAEGLAIWDQASRQSAKYEPGVCNGKWKTFSKDCSRPLTAGSLVFWARLDSPGWRPSKRSSESSTRQPSTADIPRFTVSDGFSLHLLSQRRTRSGKIVVQAKLMKSDESIVLFDVSSTVSSQAAAVKTLAKYIPVDLNPLDLSAAVNRVVVAAGERLCHAEAIEGDKESIRDIVFREVPPKFDLKFRTSDGKLWSEKRRGPVSRQEFLASTPASLIDLTQTALDAEANGMQQVRSVREALSVLWATLMETLPLHPADTTDLGDGSAAAQKFEADVFRVWTAPLLFKSVAVSRGSESGTARASLASLVTEEAESIRMDGTMPTRPAWLPIRSAVTAWWRPGLDEDGKTVLYLAMRYDLFDNLRISCEWATDQESLKRVGEQWGIFTDNPAVRGRLSDGTRLAVLSAKMVERILASPIDEETNDDFADS